MPPRHRGWVIIDEVQKVPALLDEVHRLVESWRLRFGLTGSSARKLRRRGVNLLAGRALSFTMHPLTRSELGDSFDPTSGLSCAPPTWVLDTPEEIDGPAFETLLMPIEALLAELPARLA